MLRTVVREEAPLAFGLRAVAVLRAGEGGERAGEGVEERLNARWSEMQNLLPTAHNSRLSYARRAAQETPAGDHQFFAQGCTLSVCRTHAA